MSKIDCYNTINFFKEKNRLTKDCDMHCNDCRLSSNNNGEDCDCGYLLKFHPEKAVEILQKWSDENHVKTRLDDFKEKYPNYLKEAKDGTPTACCRHLGYIDKCPLTKCSKCWNMPL